MQCTLWLLTAMMLLVPTARAVEIRALSAPTDGNERGTIFRTVVYRPRNGDTVYYHECDPDEVPCTSESTELVRTRSMAYRRYQELLAEKVGIEPRRLFNHEATERSYEELVAHLTRIIAGVNPPEDPGLIARATARRNAITSDNGVRTRFTRALGIKRNLEIGADVVYEKSAPEFALSHWPMNFALDAPAAADPLVIFEPSTERTWFLGGRNQTIEAAREACADRRGARLPTSLDLTAAAPWLAASAIGDAVPAHRPDANTPAQKRLWIETGQRGVVRVAALATAPTYSESFSDRTLPGTPTSTICVMERAH